MLNRVPIAELALIGFIMWLISFKVPNTPLLIALVLLGFLFCRPFVAFEKVKTEGGRVKIRWAWKECLALLVIIGVVYALAEGVEPSAALEILIETLAVSG